MNILVVGKGRMGSLIKATAEEKGNTVVGMIDALDLSQLETIDKPDVIIDFSHPDNLSWIHDYMNQNDCALVYGTTGLTEDHMKELKEIANDHPVFYSANYSYGIAVMQSILKLATKLLQERFDMELVETHHNQKADAPSGTAKAILSILNESQAYEEVYGREGITGARKKEIGVHAIRGGSEAGEHTVHYFGDNESITISHHASNRQIFVNGAIQAAEFIVNQAPGMYNMEDLLNKE